MGIKVNKDMGKSFELIEEGVYPARLYSIIHLGHVPGYGGEIQNQVRFTFELPTEKKVFDEEKGEQPRIMSKDVTLSFGDKSFVMELVKSTGADSSLEEFELTDLLGKACMINIEHKTAKSSGNTYAKLKSVTPLVKGMEVEAQINASFWYSVSEHDQEKFDTMPQFLQDKVKDSNEWEMKENEIIDPETGANIPF